MMWVTATVLSRSRCHTVQRLGAAAWMAGMEGSSDGTGRLVTSSYCVEGVILS